MIASLLLAAAVVTNANPDCAGLARSAKPFIDRANEDWVRAMKAHDAAAIAAAYADDGVFVLADGTEVKGRAAVEALYARNTALSAAIEGGGIVSQGTACSDQGLIYEWGEGRLRIKGRDQEAGGSYLTVWKRIGQEWKIIRNLAF